VLAAYCQAWGRWVEAEEKLRETPTMVRTPSGYVQQNPWLPVANKQLEIMSRYMAELGLTPASRSRVKALSDAAPAHEPIQYIFRTINSSKEDLAERRGRVIDATRIESSPPSPGALQARARCE
jgi:hypothetical protein